MSSQGKTSDENMVHVNVMYTLNIALLNNGCSKYLSIRQCFYHGCFFRTLPNMDIADGQYRHICISLNEQNSLQVYRNSEVILNETVFGLVFDFGNNTSKRNLTERSGILTLGLVQGISMQNFQGSLVQVNLWDQYPPFRIRRIATNCACGGGSLVSWSEILSATMVDDVDIDFQTQCPSLQGYDYNTLIQNRLI